MSELFRGDIIDEYLNRKKKGNMSVPSSSDKAERMSKVKDMPPVSKLRVRGMGNNEAPIEDLSKVELDKGMTSKDVGNYAGVANTALQLSGKGGSGAGGLASSSLSGAAAGSKFGAEGALIGAAIGGGLGILKARSAKKQRKRDAESKNHLNQAQIQQDKATRIQNALSGMGSLIAQSLR